MSTYDDPLRNGARAAVLLATLSLIINVANLGWQLGWWWT